MKKVIKVKRLIKNGGKIQPNFDKGWIYCLENSIHDSFNKLSTENGKQKKSVELYIFLSLEQQYKCLMYGFRFFNRKITVER